MASCGQVVSQVKYPVTYSSPLLFEVPGLTPAGLTSPSLGSLSICYSIPGVGSGARCKIYGVLPYDLSQTSLSLSHLPPISLPAPSRLCSSPTSLTPPSPFPHFFPIPSSLLPHSSLRTFGLNFVTCLLVKQFHCESGSTPGY